MCALWRHLVSVCEVKAHLIGCWQQTVAPSVSGSLWADLVVVAVLRYSVGTSYIVAVLRLSVCLDYNKRGLCYQVMHNVAGPVALLM